MKAGYDQQTDILMVIFNDSAVDESDEEKPEIILDYDKDGNVVGIEILDASKRVANPRSFEYAVVGGSDHHLHRRISVHPPVTRSLQRPFPPQAA